MKRIKKAELTWWDKIKLIWTVGCPICGKPLFSEKSIRIYCKNCDYSMMYFDY